MAGGSKSGEAGRREVVPDDPEQFRRFVEAARELGIEEAGEPYERAVDVILSRRRADDSAGGGAAQRRTGRKKKSLT